MNAIQFTTQPWIEHLGLTLLHFIWQGILIAAVYAVIRKWISRFAGPNARYLLACATLAVMAAAPLITWSVLSHEAVRPASVPTHFTSAAPVSTASYGLATPGSMVNGFASSFPTPIMPWVVAIWLTGAAAFWLRLLGGWVFAMRLRSRLVRCAAHEWQSALDRLKTRVQVSRPVRLLVSSLTQTPAVVGWLRPVILVPVGTLTGLPPEQVEALLLHELAHIRRHDYFVNVLQSIVEALLFYQPAVWWISAHIRAERELCCDDVAVSVSGDALTYARALVELESSRLDRWNAVMAATGGSLPERIARLLGGSHSSSRTVSGSGIAAAAMLLAITAFAVLGEPTARPKFEVASIKPAQNQGFMMVRPQPGRLTARASVRLLMQNAYTVQPFQVIGGPSWIDSDRYELEAKADGNAGRSQLFLMLQSLLEDRFALKMHREIRDLPVYALLPAKSGVKLQTPKDGSCASPTADTPAEWGGGRMQPPGQGPANLARCGEIRMMLEASGARMQGGKIPMPELVRMLSMVLGRSVIDRTGYTELFDVQLNFVPDASTPAMPAPPPDAASPDSNTPSILTAIQEQLGLRLESTKGPVEAIVIDHIERPSSN